MPPRMATTWSATRASRPEVGSSTRRTAGECTTSIAIESRLRCPPLRLADARSRRSASSNAVSRASTRPGVEPRNLAAKSRSSKVVSAGSRTSSCGATVPNLAKSDVVAMGTPFAVTRPATRRAIARRPRRDAMLDARCSMRRTPRERRDGPVDAARERVEQGRLARARRAHDLGHGSSSSHSEPSLCRVARRGSRRTPRPAQRRTTRRRGASGPTR
mmetsp:Transcript_25223/g.100427  ORF Transcript_25223/g.100427 Transcript_25223/m.100427 type:complete len:217 (-) Transcript_25223:362-1012(-)